MATTVTFGISRKMVVISERVIDNGTIYSIVTLKGERGSIKQAVKRYDGSYRII